jgi:hypothetical protein
MRTPEPHVASPVAPNAASRWVPWSAALAAVAIVNMALGSLAYTSDLVWSLKWGLYAGEYLLLAIWGSWGIGGHLRRITTIAWIGIIWMLASWIGFGIANPQHVFSYTHEMQQMFTVVPLAFAISTFPLWIMRIGNWRFHGTPVLAHHASSLDGSAIAVFAVVTFFCFHADRYVSDDLFLSAIIGPLLGAVALGLAPLLSLAFLGNRVNVCWSLPALILATVPGLAFASVFAMPGPGAAVNYFYFESVVVSCCAFFAATVAFFFWRSMGIRHSEQAVCRELQSMSGRTNG